MRKTILAVLAILLLMPVEGCAKKFENYGCSLNELEGKTGLKFFANLPAETATNVKAAKPADNAFWKRTVSD